MKIEQRTWVEKHRPEKLDDVVGNDRAINVLKDALDDDFTDHFLLSGPAGTGKTTSVQAFAREKYGDDWNSNLIELNASDDRGIDIVRNVIKNEAREAPTAGHDYKIIFLDEADSLTKDAQSALRRVMEQYSDQTVFFLSVNYLNKVIDPIQSRCSILPYNRLDDAEVEEILMNIIEREGMSYDEKAIEKIVEYVDGDGRNAVRNLQLSTVDGEVTLETLNLFDIHPDYKDIQEVIDHAVNGRLDQAIDMSHSEIIPDVIDYSKLCRDLMSIIRYNDTIHDDVRWFLISRIGQLEVNIVEGASPEVQVNSFLAESPVAQNSSIPNYQ